MTMIRGCHSYPRISRWDYKDWPHQAGEPPWVLDVKECPKPVCNVLVDSTSSMDKGKKKNKKKKKKHHRSKKTGNSELKVTTRGEGADTPVWTHAGSLKAPVQARILNLMVTVAWAPILLFSPVGIPTPNPGGVLLPSRARTPPRSPQMMTHSVTEARVSGTRKWSMLTNCKASMIPLVPDQHPVRYQRECSRVTTRWRPVMAKSLRSLKSP